MDVGRFESSKGPSSRGGVDLGGSAQPMRPCRRGGLDLGASTTTWRDLPPCTEPHVHGARRGATRAAFAVFVAPGRPVPDRVSRWQGPGPFGTQVYVMDRPERGSIRSVGTGHGTGQWDQLATHETCHTYFSNAHQMRRRRRGARSSAAQSDGLPCRCSGGSATGVARPVVGAVKALTARALRCSSAAWPA